MIRYSASLVALLMFGCIAFGNGGRRAGEVGPPADSPATSATSQQGGVNAIAKGIESAGDAFTGLTYQSTMPFGLTALLAFQSYLSHRREMMRIQKGQA